MKTLVMAALLLATLPCAAQQSEDWGKLLDQHKIVEAQQLCEGWTHSDQLSTRIEAEKCLANVALCKGQSLSLMGDDTGGGTLGSGYTPEAVDEALIHLNKGIELAPEDLSIYQGRLHVLEVAGRFGDMDKAVADSAAKYDGKDALAQWLAYDAELADMGQARAGLEFAEVLNRLYPNSHDVIGNIGAFHSMLKEPELALPFLRQAVAMAPNDPIDTWNLGRALEKLGQIPEADLWMSKAIQLDPDAKNEPDRNCLYAQFVETELKDLARACKLEKASCARTEQTACHKKSVPKPAAAHPAQP
jgi:tetratricopeptide (TPR) repeat protein